MNDPQVYRPLADALIKRLEGRVLVGYPDSGGVPTNGYGHTGPEVQIGAPITEEIAEHNEVVDRANAEVELRKHCTDSALAALGNHQVAALISFVYNLGAGDWTIWKDINAGNYDAVPGQLRRFDHGVVNGVEQVIPGLEHRRQAEIIYWNTADLGAAVAVTVTANAVPAPSSGFTRAIVTNPVPLPTPPLQKTSLAVKVGTGIAGIGATATQLHGIVVPHAAESPIFQHVAVALSAVVVLAAAVGVIISTHQTAARAA